MDIYEVAMYEENETPATFTFESAEEAFRFIVEEQRNGGWMDKRFICDVARKSTETEKEAFAARMSALQTKLVAEHGTLFDNGE